MPQKTFDVGLGVSFEGISLLPTTGAPSGTGNFAGAGVGSFAFNTTGGFYHKILNAGAPTDWERLPTMADIGTATYDWRDHAKVADLVVTALPTATATQTITVDGVVISNAERVLFTNITGGGNVYTYNQALGTFTEDTNLETAGDHVWVSSGTSGGKTFVYTASNTWVLGNQSSLDEEAYIRTYIGKSGAGSSLPVYVNSHYIGANDPLVTAIGKLDLALNNARHESSASTVTTATVVDFAIVDNVRLVEWVVVAQGTGANDSKVESAIIVAQHNGTTTVDATTPDYNISSKLKSGTITGLVYSVTLSGTGAAQHLNLVVTSTMAVNVKAIQRVIST